jgi:hypothetical protein
VTPDTGPWVLDNGKHYCPHCDHIFKNRARWAAAHPHGAETSIVYSVYQDEGLWEWYVHQPHFNPAHHDVTGKLMPQELS